MTTTNSTAADLDIILVTAKDAVWCAERAESHAYLALSAAKSNGSNAAIVYAAESAVISARSSLSAARNTLRALVELRCQFRA